MSECQNLIRGKGFPKFVKVLVTLGFLSDESVDYLATSALEIA
jgi:saccharopine dehydrogenase-like NADP-dependent oxidoreductase